MTAMEHVTGNLASAERSGVGSLGAEELALIDQLRDAYNKLSPIPCTGCKYCVPCANGVNIPHIFELYNDAIIYNDPRSPRLNYQVLKKKNEKADNCSGCRECVEHCPQNISIPEWLETARKWLDP